MKRMIHKYCILLLSFIGMSYASGLHAQSSSYSADFPQYVPQAPTAYAFAKYIDYPVSLYTGVPNISIPLYEITAGNLTIPVSLSYHASGIPASQEATRVGLGWNLNGGGVISRTVKCGDDFQEHAAPNGFYKGYLEMPEAKAPYDRGYFNVGTEGTTLLADAEPDLFFYSLPGAGGKFMLGKDSVPVLFDKSMNVRIQMKPFGGRKVIFQATTPDGTRYLFDEYEETFVYQTDGGFNLNNTTGDTDITNESDMRRRFGLPFQYVSSWFLSQIITCTNDTVTFAYEDESFQLPLQESAIKQNLLSVSGSTTIAPSWGGTKVTYSVSKTAVQSKRLSQISWAGGTVRLEYTDREDMVGYYSSEKPKKLSALKVADRNGNVIKDYALDYEYFNPVYTYANPQVYKRLKLQKLTDRKIPGYEYTFGYAEGQLPAKNTRNTDYWGYYNGTNQGADYYPAAVYNGVAYTGGKKESQFQYMKLGILETIEQPTGGTTRFVYEPNKYYSGAYYEQITQRGYSTVYKGIKDDNYSEYPEEERITITLDKTTTVTVRQFYEYVGHTLMPNNLPYDDVSYPYFTISQVQENGSLKRLYRYALPSELKSNPIYMSLSTKLTLPAGTYYLDGKAVSNDIYGEFYYEYDEMVLKPGAEKDGGGLRIARIEGEKNVSYSYEDELRLVEPIFTYTLTKSATRYTYPYDTFTAVYLMQTSESTLPMATLKNGNIFGYGTVTETFADGSKNVYTYHNQEESPSGYPFLPGQVDYFNGLLQCVVTYDSDDREVRRMDYVYSDQTAPQTLYGFVFRMYETPYPYSYRILWPYLFRSRVLENGKVTEHDYTLNDHFQVATDVYRSDNDTYTRKYTYATERSGGIYEKMKNRYMISQPVEEVLMKGNAVIGGKRTTYGESNNMILPTEESILETTVPLTASGYTGSFKPRLQYANYDAYGNARQVTRDGENHVYLWSYNGMYPVAEIQNATYQQVVGKLGESFVKQLASKIAPTEADMNKLRNLQNDLSGVLVSTYTYRPLIGMTSLTDSKGYTTYFDYDAAGRLVETYQMENGVKQTLRKYTYHYANN